MVTWKQQLFHFHCDICRVMNFGGGCVLRTYPDMMHGWTVRGDMRDQAVNNAATAAFNALKFFFNTYVN